MPDITMCDGTECNMKTKCYRHTAEPNPFRQTFFIQAPFRVIPLSDTGATQSCDYFADNERN